MFLFLAIPFITLMLLLSQSLAMSIVVEGADLRARTLANAMLTARIYADRSVGPTQSGVLDLNDVLPAHHRHIATDLGVRALADSGTVYLYLEADVPGLLHHLAEMTRHSVHVGRIMAGTGNSRVLVPSAEACKSLGVTGNACQTPAAAELTIGAVALRSGNT
ncbi:hypothetical protein [Billgrantia desiderata]|uniref:hypothetical protein n=1 Tax=Billgrantia desiderata TaxID=52021 RepID=UPI001F3CCC02|nr:hypothetical protein [Halomonas desiderata]MCE8013926.1 hypothetical protein [Halomonas desiderata]